MPPPAEMKERALSLFADVVVEFDVVGGGRAVSDAAEVAVAVVGVLGTALAKVALLRL